MAAFNNWCLQIVKTQAFRGKISQHKDKLFQSYKQKWTSKFGLLVVTEMERL